MLAITIVWASLGWRPISVVQPTPQLLIVPRCRKVRIAHGDDSGEPSRGNKCSDYLPTYSIRWCNVKPPPSIAPQTYPDPGYVWICLKHRVTLDRFVVEYDCAISIIPIPKSGKEETFRLHCIIILSSRLNCAQGFYDTWVKSTITNTRARMFWAKILVPGMVALLAKKAPRPIKPRCKHDLCGPRPPLLTWPAFVAHAYTLPNLV